MRLGHRNTWALLATAAALASGTSSCSSIEPFRDAGCFGGGLFPKLRWEITITPPGGRRGEIDGDPEYAGRCAQVTWLDENGKAIDSESFQLDDKGDGTILVPDGAVEMELSMADCPPDGGGTQGGSLDASLDASLISLPARMEASPSAALATMQRFLVLRTPITAPDHQPGKRQLTYTMNVLAGDFDEAAALAYRVADQGFGTSLPPQVEVFERVEIRHLTTAIELRASLPEPLTEFSVSVNGEGHVAALSSGTNTQLSSQGSWSTCATTIPLRAFASEIPAGGEVHNQFELHYSGTRPNTQAMEHILKSTLR